MSASIQRHLSESLFIGAGLEVGQYRFRLKDVIQELLFDIQYPDQVVEVRTMNGLSSEVVGTDICSRTVIKESVRYQRYIDVSIPVSVGLTLPLGQSSNLHFLCSKKSCLVL